MRTKISVTLDENLLKKLNEEAANKNASLSRILENRLLSGMGEPKCLMCGAELPREIKITGIHDPSCPWNYYIECKCGYQNSLSKLLGFWAGCSEKCKER